MGTTDKFDAALRGLEIGLLLVIAVTLCQIKNGLVKPETGTSAKTAINHFIDGRAVCSRCQAKDPEWHYTPHGDGRRRVFVLCEDCWKSMTPEQRIPYYKSLVAEYWPEPGRSEAWPSIKDSVLAGQ
jgi:hypothetical protein